MYIINIYTQDYYLNNGFLHTLKFGFPSIPDITINCFQNSSVNDIAQADIIFVEFIPGEPFVCQPKILARKKDCTLVIIYDDHKNKSLVSLPFCLNNAIFINRNITKEELIGLVDFSIKKRSTRDTLPHNFNCFRCRYKHYTCKQILLMNGLGANFTYKDMATTLGINVKTVYAHKKILKDRLHITHDSDFINLLPKIKPHIANSLHKL